MYLDIASFVLFSFTSIWKTSTAIFKDSNFWI